VAFEDSTSLTLVTCLHEGLTIEGSFGGWLTGIVVPVDEFSPRCIMDGGKKSSVLSWDILVPLLNVAVWWKPIATK
jgi:hypothetical protein